MDEPDGHLSYNEDGSQCSETQDIPDREEAENKVLLETDCKGDKQPCGHSDIGNTSESDVADDVDKHMSEVLSSSNENLNTKTSMDCGDKVQGFSDDYLDSSGGESEDSIEVDFDDESEPLDEYLVDLSVCSSEERNEILELIDKPSATSESDESSESDYGNLEIEPSIANNRKQNEKLRKVTVKDLGADDSSETCDEDETDFKTDDDTEYETNDEGDDLTEKESDGEANNETQTGEKKCENRSFEESEKCNKNQDNNKKNENRDTDNKNEKEEEEEEEVIIDPVAYEPEYNEITHSRFFDYYDPVLRCENPILAAEAFRVPMSFVFKNTYFKKEAKWYHHIDRWHALHYEKGGVGPCSGLMKDGKVDYTSVSNTHIPGNEVRPPIIHGMYVDVENLTDSQKRRLISTNRKFQRDDQKHENRVPDRTAGGDSLTVRHKDAYGDFMREYTTTVEKGALKAKSLHEDYLDHLQKQSAKRYYKRRFGLTKTNQPKGQRNTNCNKSNEHSTKQRDKNCNKSIEEIIKEIDSSNDKDSGFDRYDVAVYILKTLLIITFFMAIFAFFVIEAYDRFGGTISYNNNQKQELQMSEKRNQPKFKREAGIDFHFGTNSEGEKCIEKSGKYYPVDFLADSSIKKPGCIVIHLIIAIYMAFGLTHVVGHYYVPAVLNICERLGLKTNVAGATFMAAGSSVPELLAQLIGIHVAKSDVGVGNVVGSSIFNMLFIIALTGLFSKYVIQMSWYPVTRDSLFYGISVVVLFGVMQNDEVSAVDGVILLLTYSLYVLYIVFDNKLEKMIKKALKLEHVVRIDERENTMKMISYRRISRISVQMTHLDVGMLRSSVEGLKGIGLSEEQAKKYLKRNLKVGHWSKDVTFAEKETPKIMSPKSRSPELPLSPGSDTKELLKDAEKKPSAVPSTNPTPVGSKVIASGSTAPILDKSKSGQNDVEAKGSHILIDPSLDVDEELASKITDDDVIPQISPFKPPKSPLDIISWIIMMPFIFIHYFTIPDSRKVGTWQNQAFLLSYFLSIVYLSGYCYMMIWMAALIGGELDVPEAVLNLSVLAAGTGMPELITSILVARDGYGDMAISNALGSNIFNHLIAVGLPYLTADLGDDADRSIHSSGLYFVLVLLLVMVVYLLVALYINRWKLDVKIAGITLAMYLLVIVMSTLLVSNVLFKDVNHPNCDDDHGTTTLGTTTLANQVTT